MKVPELSRHLSIWIAFCEVDHFSIVYSDRTEEFDVDVFEGERINYKFEKTPEIRTSLKELLLKKSQLTRRYKPNEINYEYIINQVKTLENYDS